MSRPGIRVWLGGTCSQVLTVNVATLERPGSVPTLERGNDHKFNVTVEPKEG